MTTPERLRRRQLIEGLVLIVIGVVMIIQGFYFGHQDKEQRECLANNFRDLSVALNDRSSLVDRETQANRRVNLAELNSTTDAEYLAELQWYDREIDAIEKARDETPLPPYPVGECQ